LDGKRTSNARHNRQALDVDLPERACRVSAVNTTEPTMEEILASIRKIISEEQSPDRPVPVLSATPDVQVSDPFEVEDGEEELSLENVLAEPPRPIVRASTDVLELTDLAERLSRGTAKTERLISEQTEEQTAQRLHALSGMMVRDYDGAANTLESLVREMLKPMLKTWLDQHLPELVDRIVAREIQRISGSTRN
jgi:uncharacterized protein